MQPDPEDLPERVTPEERGRQAIGVLSKYPLFRNARVTRKIQLIQTGWGTEARSLG
jgi:hypothetical protein